ncbi:MAG: methyl-accepting chemotaxis protein [Pseudomonadota bacterium]
MFVTWTIGRGVAFVSGVTILLFAAATGVGVAMLLTARADLSAYSDQNALELRAALAMSNSVLERAAGVRDVVLLDGTDAGTAALAEISAQADLYAAALATLTDSLAQRPTAPADDILRRIRTEGQAAVAIVERVIQRAQAGDTNAATQLLAAEAKPQFFVWLAEINAFKAHKETRSVEIVAQSNAALFRSLNVIVVGLLLVVVASTVLTRQFSRAVTSATSQIIETMEALRAGARQVDVPAFPGNSEVAKISRVVDDWRSAAEERAQEQDHARLQAEKELVRAGEMESLISSVSQVVEQAVGGDLSGRVRVTTTEDDLVRLQDDVNRLLEALERSLTDTVQVVGDLSRGQLDQTLEVNQGGVIADLADSLNGTITRLRTIMSQVGGASDSIEHEVSQISSNAGTLSERSANQAATLEENSATMEEITSTVKSNASNAENALAQANEASARANRGGEIVGDAASAMERINDSSAKISDIVSVIDSIAFQTNLLALNAAVEAARAGDSGKGFAVVASEVRTLAQRSSESARDIRELIDRSSAYVADGVRLVAATGDALSEIVTAITSVSSTVSEITEASKEQARGVEEISTSIANLDSITQETAVIASTNANSAGQLEERSRMLRELLGFFAVRAEALPASEAAADADWERVAAERPLAIAAVAAANAPDPEAEFVPAASDGLSSAVPVSVPLPLAEDDDENWSEF